VLKEPLADPSALRLPGVENLEEHDGAYRFRFSGDMEPLMRLLGGLRVQEFLCEPEHLSESFFEVYREAGE
jgi:hypothetical protein